MFAILSKLYTNTLENNMKFAALLLTVLPFSLLAADNQVIHCQSGEAVRVIEVAYPQGTELPCEVQYTKDGETQVLWRASTEAGYCEDKAAQFAEKQRGWGWQCVATAGKAQADEIEQPEAEQPQN
jgi:hypothetical protein